MQSPKYNHKKIEKKWQKKWQEQKTYEPDLENAKNPFYNLMMFPYPSAEGLHVGNMYAFTGSDIYGRYQRMKGKDVFEPIGLDGFGIHSENYALKIGKHPAEQAKISEKRFYKQLESIGNGFAWDEKLETYDPEYYKWTQWIFLQLFKRGLAYRKKAEVNWCPDDKTVLADEQVVNGCCERCGAIVIKKDLEQWFFKITDYAERLLNNLEKIDWSEKVKVAQKNWIGRSEGALVRFKIKDLGLKNNFIEVFTTRPDTLFGATYLVVAPEHLLLKNQELRITNQEEIEKYIKSVAMKTDEERQSNKEKTGVELKGIKAINPANKEEIPIWVADYVLSGYGTGAIMAVPAHDERDFEFAKKFNLPIKEVVVPNIIDKRNPPVEGKKIVERKNIHAIVRDPKTEKYLAIKWKKFNWTTFPMGGIEDGEDVVTAAKREVKEETGFVNLKLVKILPGQVRAEYFAAHKDQNRTSLTTAVVFDLIDNEQVKISEEEKSNHDVIWLERSKLNYENMTHAEVGFWNEKLISTIPVYIGEGILINSGKFDGIDSEKAKWEITKLVGGEKKIQYKLRDWLISRQRYWGPPIPLIFCENCKKNVILMSPEVTEGSREILRSAQNDSKKNQNDNLGELENPGWFAVNEENLPVLLPKIKDFRPTGKSESPLASVKSFYETKCPKCDGPARRETDVSDTFLDSAWYYLAYLMQRISNFNPPIGGPISNFRKPILKNWLPVDVYIGGAEHSVLHLLYSRFLAMVFHDMKLIDFEEPFTKFRAHGLIIKEGAKMSKSKGNVVNPDFYIEKFGADTLRMYLMFLAPFTQGGDFRDQSVMGIYRFLNRVWILGLKIKDLGLEKKNNNLNLKSDNLNLQRALHQTIKKVTEDIEKLHYNTAISALMIFVNELEKQETIIHNSYFLILLKLLAPFAPHITEELWEMMGNKTSIHKEAWPKWDEKLIVEEEFNLIIQVNGKLRGTILVQKNISQEEAEKIAKADSQISKWLSGQIKKVIFVPDRLINFIV